MSMTPQIFYVVMMYFITGVYSNTTNFTLHRYFKYFLQKNYAAFKFWKSVQVSMYSGQLKIKKVILTI